MQRGRWVDPVLAYRHPAHRSAPADRTDGQDPDDVDYVSGRHYSGRTALCIAARTRISQLKLAGKGDSRIRDLLEQPRRSDTYRCAPDPCVPHATYNPPASAIDLRWARGGDRLRMAAHGGCGGGENELTRLALPALAAQTEASRPPRAVRSPGAREDSRCAR